MWRAAVLGEDDRKRRVADVRLRPAVAGRAHVPRPRDVRGSVEGEPRSAEADGHVKRFVALLLIACSAPPPPSPVPTLEPGPYAFDIVVTRTEGDCDWIGKVG